MLENGYIKDFRSLLSWEWFKDPPTAHLWEYLRLACNWEERAFRGRTIKRGQLVTSYPSMAAATGLSIQNVRTAIKHLKSTGEITVEPTDKYSVITIVKYDEYQSDGQDSNMVFNMPPNSQPTVSQQASNSQLTTIKESKKARKQESKKVWSVPLPPEASTMFSPGLRSAVTDWLTYKHERSEDYKPTGLQSLLTQIQNKAGALGDEAVCEAIRLSMSNNWRGIVWDRLEKRPAAKPGTPPNQPAQLSDWEREQTERVKAYFKAHGEAGADA